MATTCTVVFRKSKFASTFTQTGFSGSWDAAMTEADRLVGELGDAAHVYVVASTDTTVEHQGADGIVTAVKIRPTAEQKAAAAARAEAIRHMLATDTAKGWSALRGFSGRLGFVGIEHGDLFATAAYAVDHGMTWSDVARTQA